MPGKSRKIRCSACGQDTLVRAEPVFDGFTKVGEAFVCVSCGHRYEREEDLPEATSSRASLFADDERPVTPKVFAEDEGKRTCRHCKHYLVNPFTQRCGYHDKPVEATDWCDQFSSRD